MLKVFKVKFYEFGRGLPLDLNYQRMVSHEQIEHEGEGQNETLCAAWRLLAELIPGL